MATTYKNYTQAKVAYDALVAEKERALRSNEVQRAQTLKGVDRRILQNGINGGHKETTELLARSAANANAANIGLQYNPQIASLYAQLQALKAKGGYGRKSGTNSTLATGGGNLADGINQGAGLGSYVGPALRRTAIN